MNFTSLKYFLAAAEEQNITRAAEKLFISQQALSGHITRLEKELGVRLFDRQPALTLTYAGRELKKHAEEILSAQRLILQTASDINNDTHGELRVGITHTCGRALLPEILPAYRERHPGIELRLLEGNSSFLEASLASGKLDLIISYAPIGLEHAVSELLIDERLLLVVPKALMLRSDFDAPRPLKREKNSCPSRDKPENKTSAAGHCRSEDGSLTPDLSVFGHLPFIMLKEGNRIRALIDAEATRTGFRPNIILEVENLETAFALARRGMGVTVYPDLFRWCIHRSDDLETDTGVDFFPLQGETTTGALNISWMEGHYQSKAAQNFVAVCREAMENVKRQRKAFELA